MPKIKKNSSQKDTQHRFHCQRSVIYHISRSKELSGKDKAIIKKKENDKNYCINETIR
jgi:hypothetical protein